jgi:glycine betaine/choline ABC-type transport system substrate-binding protein
MRTLRLAYRDDDRTPVIFCIKEMARRHYDIDVEVVQIKGTEVYEAALFDGSCDVIIEHLEYLYDEAVKGKKSQSMERQFDAIAKGLKPRPYPTPQAIVNTYDMAVLDYLDAKDLNPLSLWDLHWVKQLDDEGFIDGLITNLAKP